MPDLSSFSSGASLLGTVIAASRIAVLAYAALATTLTTACLTLHAVMRLDRRLASRSGRLTRSDARIAAQRPLFLRLDVDPQ